MPFAVINQIRIHYEVSGQGAPVLMINGLSAPSVNWALQAKALAPHFQVITFDNRGVGETDLPSEPVYATAQMADDAAALLQHLGGVGHLGRGVDGLGRQIGLPDSEIGRAHV